MPPKSCGWPVWWLGAATVLGAALSVLCRAALLKFLPLSALLKCRVLLVKFGMFGVNTFEDEVKAVKEGALPLQFKLNDVFEELVTEEIASKFHLDRDDTMATVFALRGNVSWKRFFGRCKVMRGKTAADVGHDYLEFIDQRSMAARE